MSSATNENKTAAATASNASKTSASPKGHLKAGSAQKYDSDLTYDAVIDPVSGNKVFYDSVGTKPVITNETKS